MLVLSRQREESIIIGDNIKVTVIEIRRGLVRLGIEAPKDVTVHREEVWMEIKRSQVAEAVCDAKGLAGANAEMQMYRSGDHKQIHFPGSRQEG